MSPIRHCIAFVAGAFVLCVGCAAPTPRPVFVESPVPLIAGGPLVTPVAVGTTDWVDGRAEPPPLRLGDGQQISIRAHAFARQQSDEPGWLGAASAWRRTSSGIEDAQVLVQAPIPADGLGQSVWMEGRRVPAFWLVPDVAGQSTVSPSPIDVDLTLEQATVLVANELSDPRIRWRAELALQRIGHEAPPARWDDPVLESWAEQSAERWATAMRRLGDIDESLAQRLADALTRWLAAPETVVPVWPIDAEAIQSLILAILRPGASDESIKRTVAAFLERQPQWLAWVANDAGGVVGGAIAVVNLMPSAALLSTRAPGGRWEAYGLLEPDSIALVPAPPRRDAPTVASAWQVRLGGRTKTLQVSADAVPLEPPGLAIGPFWNDWTLEGLLTGTATSSSPGQPGWVGGLVQRDTRLDAPGSSDSGWVLYVEVRSPPCELPTSGGGSREVDAMRIAFGPSNRPRAEVVVRCSGLTTFEKGAGQLAMLTTDTDRWAFTLPIDRSWLESDGTILLGAQYVPHDGPRGTWPRPLLPGQESIGRVRVDPSAWDLRTDLAQQARETRLP